MRSRRFGPTGVQVPVLGQGTWQLRDPQAAAHALRLGVELDMTHIDTAELYRGAEVTIQRALGDRRGDLFLVSKVLPHHASYQGTLDACQKSLDRLDTDRLDAYLLHWWSERRPIDETMRAMGELVDQGLVRHVGVSNFDIPQLEAAQAALGRHRIACDQVLYHLGARGVENELLPYCQSKGIALVGYSPFGSGSFPSPASRGGKALAEVAAAHEATPYQVALNFLARHDGVFLIPKAETEAHVRQNAAALDFNLRPEDLRQIEAAFPRPAPTPLQMI